MKRLQEETSEKYKSKLLRVVDKVYKEKNRQFEYLTYDPGDVDYEKYIKEDKQKIRSKKLKILLGYSDFIKESSGYEYGCVMVDVPVSNWDEITSYIDPEDVYTGGDDAHGIQENPHLTLLYGIHNGVTEDQVKSVFEGFTGSINIKVNGIGIFENKDYDVVKFDVEANKDLQELHDKLSELPNSNSFPDYKPHITICYTKKGSGKKYIKPDYKYEVKNVYNITYSLSDGTEKKFNYTK